MSNNDKEGINPKDMIGINKVQLGLLPAAGVIHGALAMEYGAYRAGKEKKGYGPYNWRGNKVLYTVYIDAIFRHLLALRDGENYASDSKVHHLGHVIGGASIALDAMENLNLEDDRPPQGPASRLLAMSIKS